MELVQNRLLTQLAAKDDLTFKLGDTLDVKTSIGLVVIAFLGTQTAYLLDKHVKGFSHGTQMLSVVAIVVATVSSLIGLWPRTYIAIAPETNVAPRLEELATYYAGSEHAESAVLEAITNDEIEWAKSRINANQKCNRFKAQCLNVAFFATGIAVALNLITIVVVALTHPF